MTIDHYSVINQYTAQFPVYSDFTFASLWCWGGDQCSLSDLNGNLVIRLPDYTTQNLFLSFIGRHKIPETVDALLAMIKSSPLMLPYLQAIPEDALQGVTLDSSYQVLENRSNYDYVCDPFLLAKMAGDPYKRLRNKINRFMHQYQWQIKELDLQDQQSWHDIESVFVSWKGRHKKTEALSKAIGRVRHLVDRMAFIAVGLYVEDHMIGFSINEPSKLDYVSGLFLHADTSYIGSFGMLTQQTAILVASKGHRHHNIQPDMGLPGLREAKLLLRPAFYLKKWIISHPDLASSDRIAV